MGSLLQSTFLQLSLSKPSKTFLNGSSSLALRARTPAISRSRPFIVPRIQAMKSMQGRVVCATNDKTVAVEVVRLAPHRKYKRRIRKKKKYQAHDPENELKVGDYVQLEKCRPISKTKTFLAKPVTAKNVPKAVEPVPLELGLPFESQEQQA